MKVPLFILLLLSLSLNAQQGVIVITGKTNVNTFKCTNTNLKTGIDLDSSKLPQLTLKIDDFDCRNKMMTSDFRKTLNSAKYPELHIRFTKLHKLSTSGYYQATLLVKFMNKTHPYSLTFFLDENQLVGNKKVLFTDFGITPPKKMGGTIQVKDALDLSVSLRSQ